MTARWRTQQKEQLRLMLFETALKLFREQGYEATTVQQITSRAGIAKGTFFNYFSSKDQVLAEWHGGVTDEALGAVTGRSYDGAKEAVMALMDALADKGQGQAELLLMTARNVVASDTLSVEEQSLDAQLLEFIRQQIKHGARRGEFGDGFDQELLATMIITTLTGTTHEWVVSRQGFDLKVALRQRIAFLFPTDPSAPQIAAKGDSLC